MNLGPSELTILICLSPVLLVGAVALYVKYLRWLKRR